MANAIKYVIPVKNHSLTILAQLKLINYTFLL